ncbi:hypothetical protein F1188_01685 [Roseospira marina]|uniref:Uncharacterized protein n=1 Tax=Roseospira marina TaxID=140057 RepID=A0A5M6IH54_9PROT|nr:hypothetical protein [Roseospira marina]KAA5607502.1 hypothetical protein F1188_01685 [Roseospira marina]MBB4312316.1 hypothetical protein [Roseospira marina]MBB5085668.1 hypothetical protein [Roseospira marina]
MSFLRRLLDGVSNGLPSRHGIQVGDRYVKTDGQYQSMWTVRQIVHFEGIPPHARLVPDQDAHLGYRTISVTALDDPGFYKRIAAQHRRVSPY